jgi:aspartyl-tRNA(Asn)/glutamyl-tRNA(Gln) amidotransferase subunit A
VAYASSLDQIGPITKDVRDCAAVMNVIAGRDDMDSTSADLPVPNYLDALTEDVSGLTIGIPSQYFTEGLDPQVGDRVMEAVRVFQEMGVKVEDVSLPHTEYAVATYYILATAEASSNLARYDGVKYGYRVEDYSGLRDMYHKSRSDGFGTEVKRRIMLGTYVLSAGYYDAYYEKAQRVRTLIRGDFEAAFEKVDLLIAPTSPTSPFKLGEKLDDPLQMYLSDVYTISANLGGIPAISIPCGFTDQNLPVGLQIMGRPFDEGTILRAAYAFEQSTDHHLKKPPL